MRINLIQVSSCALCDAAQGHVPSKHQARIIRENAKLNPALAGVMGGPSPEESQRIINEHKAHRIKGNLVPA